MAPPDPSPEPDDHGGAPSAAPERPAAAEPVRAIPISEVAERVGLTETTLRAWEARYGFPAPLRLPGGHRRYREEDVVRLREVVRLRDEGYPTGVAIEQMRAAASVGDRRGGVYLVLQRLGAPAPALVPKDVLVRISRALEDEIALLAERPVLLGGFQEERHFRASEARWRSLASTAASAVVFATFPASRPVPGGPTEIAVDAADPVTREWLVVCDDPAFTACLVAWERLDRPSASDAGRLFSALWTFEPPLVRAAAALYRDRALGALPELAASLPARLWEPAPPAAPEVRHLTAVAGRMLRYGLEGASRARAPRGDGHAARVRLLDRLRDRVATLAVELAEDLLEPARLSILLVVGEDARVRLFSLRDDARRQLRRRAEAVFEERHAIAVAYLEVEPAPAGGPSDHHRAVLALAHARGEVRLEHAAVRCAAGVSARVGPFLQAPEVDGRVARAVIEALWNTAHARGIVVRPPPLAWAAAAAGERWPDLGPLPPVPLG